MVNLDYGFTPAYAGKIPKEPIKTKPPVVHPRIRGEDAGRDGARRLSGGSPPHTRGRYDIRDAENVVNRFTPAYAGKMTPFALLSIISEVHPRIRGEDRACLQAPESPSGSPPHTRGRSPAIQAVDLHVGFTPAYAGKIIL